MQSTFIHQTDLFRPHNDPDDHWDLACAFAIAKHGWATLAGVLIDHPPGPPVLNHASDPDVGAVAQLAHLTGNNPSIAVGNATLFSDRDDLHRTPAPAGVEYVLRTLQRSVARVAIAIVGSARDIAEAIQREPRLFAEKCQCIYLVAGSGSPDAARVKSLEWNVALDPLAYAQIFQAPCPVYWMPCLEDEDRVATDHARAYACHYRFAQKPVLDALPRALRSFFGFMYERRESSFWLHALEEDFSEELRRQAAHQRMMYSTPLFFDLAGLCVTRNGEALSKFEPRNDWVYRFEPVEITCSAAGVTQWHAASRGSDRSLFHVLDTDAYADAMTRAMTHLLVSAFSI